MFDHRKTRNFGAPGPALRMLAALQAGTQTLTLRSPMNRVLQLSDAQTAAAPGSSAPTAPVTIGALSVGFNAELGAPVAHRGGNRHHFGRCPLGRPSLYDARERLSRPVAKQARQSE
jgi:hypothetical protein